MSKQPESRLQRKIRKALEAAFPRSMWLKYWGGPFTVAGVPDLLGVVEGRFVGLEVKRPGHEATLIQQSMHRRLERAGGIIAVVTSCAEAIDCVRRAMQPRFGDPRLPERFWSKLKIVQGPLRTPCWQWQGYVRETGYVTFRIGDLHSSIHRWAYELLVGAVPDGLELDHLCRARHCANPDHLEPVTRRVNLLRGSHRNQNTDKTHCKNGHPLAGDNLYLKPSRQISKRTGKLIHRRVCRICKLEGWRRRHAAT